MRTPPPLRVDFERSRWRIRWIVASHGATALLLALLPRPWPVRGFAAVLVAALALRALRNAPPAGLVLRMDATVVILETDGRTTDAALTTESYTGTLVTTLVLRVPGKRTLRTCVVLPDMLPAEDFRRLRVRLRYVTSAVEAGAPASHACASTSAALSPFG